MELTAKQRSKIQRLFSYFYNKLKECKEDTITFALNKHREPNVNDITYATITMQNGNPSEYILLTQETETGMEQGEFQFNAPLKYVDMLTLEVYVEHNQQMLYIGTECGSGAKYKVNTFEDIGNAVTQYLKTYTMTY